ncbi:MAG: hypothetical protein ISN26_08100, partial [Betaproteobacteria bacterium AqS2]|nr:hypothetical protein [Betaproteobacteria bacterium AqS2]
MELFFKANAGVTAGSTVSVTVVATPNSSCTAAATPAPLTVAWNMTIAETSGWVNQGRDDAVSDGPFSALTLTTAANRTDTGMAFHRSAEGCRQINVALSGDTGQVELIRYAGDSAATQTGLSNITMFQNNADDHHVKLFLKARAAVTQGDVLDLTIVATPNSSCTDARTPSPLTVSWNITIATAATWVKQGADDDSASGSFSPLTLAAASNRTATGLAFHRNSDACKRIDIALSGDTSHVELRRYAGTTEASSQVLSDITMDDGATQSGSNQHVRLFFKAGAAPAGGSVLNVTIVATPNAACTDARTPAPLTVGWALTVASTSPWVDQGRDSAAASGAFSALTLTAAASRTDTELAFHRSALGCRQIDVALSGDTGQVELLRYQGSSAATPTSLSNITMHSAATGNNDHHVRLFLKARAAVTQGDVLDLTIVATPNSSCTDPRTPAPLTVSWNVTIATAANWVKESRDDDSASGSFSPLSLSSSSSRTDTGLAFHRNSDACKRIDVALSGDVSHVELRRYAGESEAGSQALSDITMNDDAAQSGNNQHVRLFFKAGTSPTAGSVLDVTIVATPNAACTDPATPAPLTVGWNLTVASTSPWVNQGRDDAVSEGPFSALTLATTSSRTDTGLAFHRSADGCRQIDVELSGDTGQVELIRYQGGSAATPSSLSNITMHKDATGSNDHHVKLFLKSRAAVAQGAVLDLTIVATPNPSCTDPRTPPPLTVRWNLTIATASAWTNQGSDETVSDGQFSALTLTAAAQRTDTGLAFHRSAVGCRQIDVALSGDTGQVELLRYQGNSAATPTALSNITMHSAATPASSNHHVKLFLKSRANVSGGDVLDLTIVATPNSSCTDPRTPAPLTVAWNVTIASASPWVDQGLDSTAADDLFSALTLTAATSRTDTGIAFHRSSAGCRQIDVALSGETSHVELVRHQGASVATPSALSNITMEAGSASDHHVRLFLKARAAVTQGDVLDLTLTATPNASCTNPRTPAPLTVSWAVTIATPAAWVKQSRDDDSASGSFSALRLTASSARTDTGLAFHRNSAACSRIDIALNGDTGQVELRRYQGGGEAGSQALSNIVMDDGAASSLNQHVRLFFKAGAAPAAGSTLNVTIVATPNAACDDPRTPAPLTVGWAVTVAAAGGWVNQGRDSQNAASQFSPLRLPAATARTDTGIAFHQSSVGCRSIDVALAAGAPAYLELVRYQDDAVAAGGLGAIHMERDHASDQHVRLLFKPGAAVTAGAVVDLTLVATPNASCTDPRTPAPLTVGWSLTIATPAAWVNQGHDNPNPHGPLEPLVGIKVNTPTTTGVEFHRSSTACRQIDVALAIGTPTYVRLVRHQNDRISPNQSMRNIRMMRGDPADEHVHLFYSPSALVVPGSTVSVTMVASPNASCTDPATPAPLTVGWALTIAEEQGPQREEWLIRSKDQASASQALVMKEIEAATAPMPTGIAFHRS